jgi:hypothetical protein
VLENLIKVTKFIEKLDERAKDNKEDDEATHRSKISKKSKAKPPPPNVPDVIHEEEEFDFD